MAKLYQIAFCDFSNMHLGASCAALMEMLGRDSSSFRIDLQCAERIAKFSDGQAQKGLSCIIDFVCYLHPLL